MPLAQRELGQQRSCQRWRSKHEQIDAPSTDGRILQLQRAGISTTSAKLPLKRMLAKIEGLCAERDYRRNRRTSESGWQIAMRSLEWPVARLAAA